MNRIRGDIESDEGMDEHEVVGTFETLRDEGEHFLHVKQFERAIESFTKALGMKSGDKTCLVTRAKCFLMLGDCDKALVDVESALENDEENKGKDMRALCMKAEALYQRCDFETALVFFHRGHRIRPELQEFRLGIQKSQEAINNSIGSPDTVKLEANGDLSYFYKDDEKQKRSTYRKPVQKQEREEKERVKPHTSSSKTAKQLLGEIYRDREFLDRLYNGLASNDQNETDRYIGNRALDCLYYLDRRVDFWRQQNPMYSRQRERRRKLNQHSSAHGRGGRYNRDPMQYILQQLEEIDDAQANGYYDESLKKSLRTMKKVEQCDENSIKNKPAIVANLFSCIGNAHLEMGNFTAAIDHHSKDLAIGEEYHIEEAESRGLDNMGRTMAKMGKYVEAIEIWERKIPKTKSTLENTWLFHEIGRCYLELGKVDEAKDYGEKSLIAANEADDAGWRLHATVLIGQAEVKSGDLSAAVTSFEHACEIAERLDDASACAAIMKAIEEVNAMIVKGTSDVEKDPCSEENDGENSTTAEVNPSDHNDGGSLQA